MLKMDVDDFKEEQKRKWEERNAQPWSPDQLDFWEPYKEGCSMDEFEFTFDAARRVVDVVATASRNAGLLELPSVLVECGKRDLVLLKICHEAGLREFVHEDGMLMAKTAMDFREKEVKWRMLREANGASLRRMFGMPFFDGIEEVFDREQALLLNLQAQRVNKYFEKNPAKKDEIVWYERLRFPEVFTVPVTLRVGKGDSHDQVLQFAEFIADQCKLLKVAGLAVTSPQAADSVDKLRDKMAQQLGIRDSRSLSTHIVYNETNFEESSDVERLESLFQAGMGIRVASSALFAPIPDIKPAYEKRRYWD